jgi:N6-adenosine-specific RNA methylase IME4
MTVLFLTLPDTHLFVTGVPMLGVGLRTQERRGLGQAQARHGEIFPHAARAHARLHARQGLPEPKDKVGSVIAAPRGKHSEKPQKLFDAIERMYPQFFRKDGEPLAVELFARSARKGWTAWGNQAPQAETAKAA